MSSSVFRTWPTRSHLHAYIQFSKSREFGGSSFVGELRRKLDDTEAQCRDQAVELECSRRECKSLSARLKETQELVATLNPSALQRTQGEVVTKDQPLPDMSNPPQQDTNNLRSAYTLLCRMIRETISERSMTCWSSFARRLAIKKNIQSLSDEESRFMEPLLNRWLERSESINLMSATMTKERLTTIELALACTVQRLALSACPQTKATPQSSAAPPNESLSLVPPSQREVKQLTARQVMMEHLLGSGGQRHALPIASVFAASPSAEPAKDTSAQYSLTPTQIERIMAVTAFIPSDFGRLSRRVKQVIIADVIEFVLRLGTTSNNANYCSGGNSNNNDKNNHTRPGSRPATRQQPQNMKKEAKHRQGAQPPQKMALANMSQNEYWFVPQRPSLKSKMRAPSADHFRQFAAASLKQDWHYDIRNLTK